MNSRRNSSTARPARDRAETLALAVNLIPLPAGTLLPLKVPEEIAGLLAGLDLFSAQTLGVVQESIRMGVRAPNPGLGGRPPTVEMQASLTPLP